MLSLKVIVLCLVFLFGNVLCQDESEPSPSEDEATSTTSVTESASTSTIVESSSTTVVPGASCTNSLPDPETISEQFNIYIIPGNYTPYNYFVEHTPLGGPFYLNSSGQFGNASTAAEFVLIQEEEKYSYLALVDTSEGENVTYSYAALSVERLREDFFVLVDFDSDYCDVSKVDKNVVSSEWYTIGEEDDEFTSLGFFNEHWEYGPGRRGGNGEAIWCYGNLEAEKEIFNPGGSLRAWADSRDTDFGGSCEEVGLYIDYVHDDEEH